MSSLPRFKGKRFTITIDDADCIGCPKMDLKLQNLDFLSFTSDEKFYGIRCIHEDACERVRSLADNVHGNKV